MKTSLFELNKAHIECAIQSRTGFEPDDALTESLLSRLDREAVLEAAEEGGDDFAEVCELAYDEIYEQSLAIA